VHRQRIKELVRDNEHGAGVWHVSKVTATEHQRTCDEPLKTGFCAQAARTART
jgi:hypothetical protein